MRRTVENVQKLIDEGKSVSEIAKVFGVTYTPMRMWMKSRGLKTNFVARKWSNQDLINAVSSSKNKASVIRKLGLQVRPGNYRTIEKYIKHLNLDISHFTGCAHGTTIPKNKKLNKEIFIKDSDFSRNHLKKRIIQENLIDYECQKCGLKDEWQNEKLVLVLDHINGINNDDRLDNLRFLCPNCNSQTRTFCRGQKRTYTKRIRKKSNNCKDCSTPIFNRSIRCQKCNLNHQRLKRTNFSHPKIANRPSLQQLEQDLKELKYYTKVGKKYGVSDNCIRKWINKYKNEN